MSTSQSNNFTGIVSCIGSFDHSICLTKTIEFSMSSILFLTGLVILYQYIRFFGFSGKVYISLALFFLSAFLLINMIYCFWNTIYEFYSIETYFHNLYFLSIVVYTTKSYLLKQPHKPKLSMSRVSDLSNDSSEQNGSNFLSLIKRKIVNNIKFYKLLYKSMTIVFLLLFTLIFITSLIGDIKSKQSGQNLAEDQGQQEDFTLFSFLKDSCEELWYLCVNGICVVLSLIVLIVLYKNYYFEQERIKNLTLVTTTVHEKKAPFINRDSRSSGRGTSMVRNVNKTTPKMNNPLKKLAFWMGLNIFGEIINLTQSGLLLNADPMNECQIIPNNRNNNSILMLVFVFLSSYVQYSASLWFFYDTLRQKLNITSKTQALLIQAHEYSQEIRVGQIELNPSLRTSSSNDE